MKAIVDYPWTRVSNQYLALMGDMSHVEIKVVGAVIRHSVGWDNQYAELSYSDLMRITKTKSRTSLSNGIKSAISKGYLAVDSKTGKRGKKRYSIGKTLRESPQNEDNISTTDVPDDMQKEIVTSADKRTSTSTLNAPENPLTGTIGVPHKKKEVLKEIDKENNSRSACEESSTQEVEVNTVTPSEQETVSKPYTQDEYEWYVESGRCSEDQLRHFVYCPISHNYTVERGGKEFHSVLNTIWEDRQSLLNCHIKSDANSWNMTVDLIQHFWNIEAGQARRIATLLLGTAKTGKWKTYRLDNPMSPEEVYAFGLWIFEMRCVESGYKPFGAQEISEYAKEFRALPNHFEHINYASYKINEFFAEPIKAFEPDPDDERFHIVPKEQLDKTYAEAEALLGFSLSGDF